MKQRHFKRHTLVLPSGEVLYALTSGLKAQIFVGSDIVTAPSLLLHMPGILQWLLAEELSPETDDPFMGATVIPQMGCNAACGYCIQNLRTTPSEVERVPGYWMNDQMIRDTVAFIERQRQSQKKKGVILSIFGGEPLLNVQRCYRLLEEVEHLASASIITNGVLLTPEVATGLTARGVHSIQITFDGAREQHDAIRVLAANGGGTYDRIVYNLQQVDALPVLPHRQLRVNVTRSNLARLDELVDDLAEKLNPTNWTLYFALVDDNGIGWNDGLNPDELVGSRLAQLARQAAAHGFIPSLPSSKTVNCSYCSDPFGQGGMVVNADGRLYSCWDTAGFPDMSVGHVRTGYASPRDNDHKWVQCGFRSTNGGSQAPLEELNWALREIAVAM
jgi:uncharacterized protein